MRKRVADAEAVTVSGAVDGDPTVTPVEGEETVYRTTHDMTKDGLSVTISQALAEVADAPATELVADFAEHADPDALDRLFRAPPADPDARSDGHVVLRIRDYRVTVCADGRILIAESGN